MHDYIPRKDAELVAWSANFTAQVANNAVQWNIPSQYVVNLQTENATFSALHAQADSPAKTPVIVAEKITARAVLETRIRTFANFWLKNPAITAAERIAMGLHVRSTTRSAVPVPATRPELSVNVLDVRRLKVAFRDRGSASKARPYGISGAVISYAVLPSPPPSPAALTRSVLATRTPFTLRFTEEERGRTVYIAICWQNEKGRRGPLSEIESAIVP
jgi:hypothetical protein